MRYITIFWKFLIRFFYFWRFFILSLFFRKIEDGRTRDAHAYQVQMSNQLAEELRLTTNFWVLRRTKQQVQEATEVGNSSGEPSEQVCNFEIFLVILKLQHY